MQAISTLQATAADQRSGRLTFFAPSLLAIGGMLTVAWTCALSLCAYDLLCWLFG